jgi:RNA polymerase sigma-70 factor (ECF subfamily)
MASIATFEALRPYLISVAYRMLGSSADAEDAVQDAWLRWEKIDEAEIRDPKAWLSTVTGRICLDRLTSAQARRQVYPGEWLPEPVVSDEPLDMESLSLGFLVLLERLSPLERITFVLHQVFDYQHAEIAEALGMNAAAVRQAFHRAKQHVVENRPRFTVKPEDHERLLRGFLAAITSGDVERMTQLLANDAVMTADGGGKVRGAAQRPIQGAERIARFFAGLLSKVPLNEQYAFAVRSINGWPAVVGGRPGRVELVMTIDTDGERILALRNVVNPDKLRLPLVD